MAKEYKKARVIHIDNNIIMIRCPFCNKIHIHGTGGFKLKYNTYRLSHCQKNNKEYIIDIEKYYKKVNKKVYK